SPPRWVHKFDGLLQLVKGIDRLEVSVPIIKEQPQEIHNQAKSKVSAWSKPYAEKVYELQQAFQQKAASLKRLAERLLDYYCPKCEGDDEITLSSRFKEDPPCTPFRRLSNKVARRVYRTVSKQVKTLRKEDVKEYVVTLIAVLRLTQYSTS
ncbi:lipid storage droplets surface-binding protein 2, partial [Aedes aegypti]|uniref:Uncharacterized protein n=1 Tax=Aedes aegypti TaxID=7159 RepID=A0A903VGS0_AEDAE